MAIGPWNDTGYNFVLAPNAHGWGNLIANKNIGNVASFPAGASQNCVLTGMGTDDGLIAGRGDAHLKGDGVNNHIETQHELTALTAGSFTMGYRFIFNQTGALQVLSGIVDDGSNNFNVYVDGSDKFTMRPLIAGTAKAVVSGDALTDGQEYLCHAVKDSNNPMKLFINGAEPSSYSQQDSWTLANKTYTNKLHVMQNHSAAAMYVGKMYWFGIADGVAFDATRALEEYNLGRNFGLAGINTVDSLALFGAPLITSLDIIRGPVAGGTVVTITGNWFAAAQGGGGVTFGGAAATINSWSNTSIECVTPAGSPGLQDVVVTRDNDLTVTETNGFEYFSRVGLRLSIGDGIGI